jgi:hypothetical protein
LKEQAELDEHRKTCPGDSSRKMPDSTDGYPIRRWYRSQAFRSEFVERGAASNLVGFRRE